MRFGLVRVYCTCIGVMGTGLFYVVHWCTELSGPFSLHDFPHECQHHTCDAYCGEIYLCMSTYYARFVHKNLFSIQNNVIFFSEVFTFTCAAPISLAYHLLTSLASVCWQ